MDLLQFFKDNASKFEGVSADVVETLASKAKEAGFSLIANNNQEPSYLPKSRFDEVNGERKTLKTQIEEQEKTLKDLKKAAEGSEELTKQIEAMQKSNKDLEVKLAETRRDGKIETALTAVKARPELFGLIDKNKIEVLEDGTIKGLDDQIKHLQETKNYLFETEAQKDIGGGTNPASNTNQDPTDFSKAPKDQVAAELSKFGIRLPV